MSRNIKEIGKELLGKSLNSFHRKTGLTQLEKNNEMQDGILDGILSQVDDAYIEKTEQSNVIHLDGSGDGVVVVDSIEGNTMVNLAKDGSVQKDNIKWKVEYPLNAIKNNTTYTVQFELCNIVNNDNVNDVSISIENVAGYGLQTAEFKNGVQKFKLTTRGAEGTITNPALDTTREVYFCAWILGSQTTTYSIKNIVVLEGDWTEKEIPSYFEGLQSSFEEKVNDEGKYEIEILSKNKNLLDIDYLEDLNNYIKNNRAYSSIPIKLKPNTTYTISLDKIGTPLSQIVLNVGYDIWESPQNHYILSNIFNVTNAQNNPKQVTFTTTNQSVYYLQYYENGHTTSNANMSQWFTRICNNIQLEEGNLKSIYAQPKQNKIKLLINEPLRAVGDIKDVLCIKDNRLMVERKLKQRTINGTESWSSTGSPSGGTITYSAIVISDMKCNNNINNLLCDKFPTVKGNQYSYTQEMLYTWQSNNGIYLHITTSKLPSNNLSGFKTYLQNNNFKFVYELKEPVYEEVLNEYGEPIILEGYENGTIYIDSTIVPTTTVRYTPKMESLNTLKEVGNNNIMLTNDVNDNIIPYMMDVDLMIMEKEMALMSQYKIRRIGESDMTSMQKRTQDMLTRLIKGKTLTEQECKTRVVTYLDAGKITDEQADELMLLISEVYA